MINKRNSRNGNRQALRSLLEMHLILAILVAAFLSMQNGYGSNCSDLHIEIEHDSLEISAWLDKGDEMNGDLRLTSKGGDFNISDYKILSDDLKMDGSDNRISRRNVKILGLEDLKRDMPLDVQVNISGLKEPGTYRGNLMLLYGCGGIVTSKLINLTVIARTTPVLTPATSKLSLQLVNSGCLESILAGRLLPRSSFDDQINLTINNIRQAPITLRSANILIEGDTPGNQFAELAISLKNSSLTTSQPIISIPLKIDREKIPADRYVGSVILFFDGQQNPISIPLEMKVRNGPFWAIVFLLFGIVFGQVYKHYQDSGRFQAEAMKDIYRLRSLIMPPNSDPCPGGEIGSAIDGLERSLYNQKWDKTKLDDYLVRIKTISNRLEMLERLKTFRTLLDQLKTSDSEKTEVIKLIDETRAFCCNGEDNMASKGLEKIKEKIAALRESKRVAKLENANSEESRVIDKLHILLSLEDSLFNLHKKERPPINIERLKALWNLHAESIFYLALIILLLYIGLLALYVNEGAIFGASPFSDYVKVLTWGLAGDIAGRTITGATKSQ